MRNFRNITFAATLALAIATLSSCGTKKIATGSTATTTTANKHTASDDKTTELQKINFLRKVTDNAVYAQNIVSKIKLDINTGSNEISVAGSLHMRRDAVIRIQITPFGIMEAGRLEFTKDHVLLVDRIHKEYVKASYSDVDFLARNGLDFYALQALFWNQLFVPGTQKTTDSSLKNFSATIGGGQFTPISISYGKMSYLWSADTKTALLRAVDAKYSGSQNDNTSVSCKYSDFKTMGTKQFPTDILLTLSTKAVRNANKMSLRLHLNTLGTDSDWEAETTVSSKYKQVSADEILKKLGSL